MKRGEALYYYVESASMLKERLDNLLSVASEEKKILVNQERKEDQDLEEELLIQLANIDSIVCKRKHLFPLYQFNELVEKFVFTLYDTKEEKFTIDEETVRKAHLIVDGVKYLAQNDLLDLIESLSEEKIIKDQTYLLTVNNIRNRIELLESYTKICECMVYFKSVFSS